MSADLNQVLLRGTVVSDAITREHPSGEVFQSFDLRVNDATVPVLWQETRPITRGLRVVVTGHVERRFFRVAGATQSRTNVRAHSVRTI